MKTDVVGRKINFLNILIIFISFTLSGCASGPKYAKHKVNPLEFQANNKAIVITQMKGKKKGVLWGENFFPVQYSIAKVDSNYENVNTRHRYRKSEFISPKYDILMIEPGEYTIEELSYGDGTVEHYTTADGYSPEDKQYIFGHFTVKPNEIVYLGDLEIVHNNKKKPITVFNSSDKAIEYFKKKHPQLADRTITKKDFVINENPYPISPFSEKVIQRSYTPVYLPS